jgi:hypothetical protein
MAKKKKKKKKKRNGRDEDVFGYQEDGEPGEYQN